MVDSINGTSSAPSVLSPHTATRSDAADSGKTDDVRGEKLNNSATLSDPKTDSTKSREIREGESSAGNDEAVHLPETVRNEPPGSRVDILA